MGGELLSKPPTMTRLFWDAYPAYLNMGMPPDEYWDGDAMSCVAYRTAHKEKLKMQDLYAHRQGLYIYHALCAVAPYFNSIRPKPPEDYIRPFSEEEKKHDSHVKDIKDKQDNFKALVTLWAINVNKKRKEANGREHNRPVTN